MADRTDVLLKLIEQQWIEAKQSEDQRAALTNLILIIAAAAIGFMAQKPLQRGMLFISLSLIVLGVFGAITSAKYYERHQFHIERLKQLREKLNLLHPDADIETLRNKANDIHNGKFPYLSQIRLYRLWVCFHVFIVISGTVISLLILLKTS